MVEDLSSFKKSIGSHVGDTDKLNSNVEETPIVTLINKIITKALTTESSEIHIEPQKDQLMVRFCQEGGMRTIFDPFPQGISSAVISRLKVMADLDINQRDICQKGRIEKNFSGRTVEFLVTTLSSHYGEKVMLQLLTPLVSQSHQNTAMTSSSTHLAYRLQELERLLKALTYEFQQLKEDLVAESISPSSDSVFAQESSSARDEQTRKRDLEADKMTITSDSLIYEEMSDVKDWQTRKKDLEADKMTITSESLIYEEMSDVKDWQTRKQDLETDKMTVISDSSIDDEIAHPRHWQAIKQDLEADKMTITSDSQLYEELTDPGDWEQLKRALESDKATIISESLPEKKLPDPW